MKALVTTRNIFNRILNLSLGKPVGQGAEVKDVPIPAISDLEILVKVHAVGLNPTDYKHIDIISPPNSICGCDYAGEVVDVGKNAKGGWKVGDRVAGCVHGGLYSDRGSFAEFLKVDGDLAWMIPEGISDEAAATYGISAVTAMLALHHRLGIRDGAGSLEKRPCILIYAASTSVGLYALQLASRAGYTVVATASPSSFDLVRQYGADRVFDYRSETAIRAITAAFPDINYALDCFSEGNSSDFCAKVIGKNGGRVITLLDTGKPTVPGVEKEMIFAYTLFGRPFAWLPPIGPSRPAIPSDREALVEFYRDLPMYLPHLKPPPITVTDDGFEGIKNGLEKLRRRQVSGGKIVVKL
ncbi:hypothetical protein BDW75DRAFT_223383 [Aspergillus navahoensis]